MVVRLSIVVEKQECCVGGESLATEYPGTREQQGGPSRVCVCGGTAVRGGGAWLAWLACLSEMWVALAG